MQKVLRLDVARINIVLKSAFDYLGEQNESMTATTKLPGPGEQDDSTTTMTELPDHDNIDNNDMTPLQSLMRTAYIPLLVGFPNGWKAV